MTDFAKSILGLGFKKDVTPSDYGHKKFLPKNLASHPTTAVSSSSMAYGTTTSTPAYSSGQLSQAQSRGQSSFASHTHPSVSGDASSTAHRITASAAINYGIKDHGASDNPHVAANPRASDSAMEESSPSPPDASQPVIITTDEKGQHSQAKTSSQPKGKLKVTIIAARDLLISEYSQPYVVSTYECSEFVNNSTPSRSPMLLAQNHNQSRLSPGMPMKQPRDKRPALYQRQSSTQQFKLSSGQANQVWNHEAVFDVVGSNSELDISVYDAAKDDAFLGQVRIVPNTDSSSANKTMEARWEPLRARVVGERVTGQLQIKWQYTRLDSKKSYGPDDFEVLRLLGKGTFGQVYQVKNKDNGRIYAMKILSKKLIVKKKEIAHTIGERNILVRTSAAASPFIVGLKFSFQTPTDLYLVTDYMSGGELFWHLQKEGRFNEDRAKFYIAELVLALEHLHDNDIVYRDLKPENILLDAKGHIALCDFGLSKANLNNDGTTNTFCGTTEYLAPEVLLDESGYTKMVDFWSLGVLIFEMCCGWSPFYADNTQQMYKNIAFGKVRFPKEVLSPEGRSFVKGLLNRNPRHRLGALKDARELKEHPFFQDVDWNLLKAKDIPPPFKPHLSSETDTSNFDPEFTNESTSVLKKHMEMASTPLSPGIQANFKGFTYVDDSAMDDHFSKSHRYQAFKNSGSFIPGNTNLPPDDEVIDDQIDEEDEMEIDNDANMESEEFVHGRFDL
ncbi:Serine/threonine-protein kinase [Candidozyma auris]